MLGKNKKVREVSKDNENNESRVVVLSEANKKYEERITLQSLYQKKGHAMLNFNIRTFSTTHASRRNQGTKRLLKLLYPTPLSDHGCSFHKFCCVI
jgi:hypothetical protein